ncbi:hypothetical protein STEG23_013053 [Scotinomys teguina]
MMDARASASGNSQVPAAETCGASALHRRSNFINRIQYLYTWLNCLTNFSLRVPFPWDDFSVVMKRKAAFSSLPLPTSFRLQSRHNDSNGRDCFRRRMEAASREKQSYNVEGVQVLKEEQPTA